MSNRDAPKTRVALFRAHDDAALSAARLRRLGYSASRLPATEVVPLAFAPMRRRYDAVVATSAKAFLADAPIDRTALVYAVGAKTARAAESRGFRLGAPPAPDSARLVETLRRILPPGAAALYLAGRDRKAGFEAALACASALEVVESYAAEARSGWRPGEIRALGASEVALHYSCRSAALAAALAQAAGVGAHFRLMAHVCLSGDVAEPLAAIGVARTFVAESPDEAALFAALMRAAPLFPSLGPSRI